MDKKVIIVIAAVAIIVVAAACVLLMQPQEQKVGGTEAYTDIKVGDVSTLQFEMVVSADITEDLLLTEALEGMYFDLVGVEPTRTSNYIYGDEIYVCYVYEIKDGYGFEISYYVNKESGVLFFAEFDDGYMRLKSTSCDVNKPILEQEVGLDTYYTYEVKTTIPGLPTMYVVGESVSKVTAIGDGHDCKLNTSSYIKESEEVSVKLATIDGDVYKFENDGTEYTKDGAASYYSYTSCMNDIKAAYGEGSVVMGDKSTAKIPTAYGDREVTVQKVKVDVYGNIAELTFYYGSKDVLYKTEMFSPIRGLGEITLSADLVHCDTVKSL